jgi:hypothetical protein
VKLSRLKVRSASYKSSAYVQEACLQFDEAVRVTGIEVTPQSKPILIAQKKCYGIYLGKWKWMVFSEF